MSRYDLDAPQGYSYDQEEALRRAIEESLRETNAPPPRTGGYPAPPSVSNRLRSLSSNAVPQEPGLDDELELALRLSIEEEERRKQKEDEAKRKGQQLPERPREETPPQRQSFEPSVTHQVAGVVPSPDPSSAPEPQPLSAQEQRELVRRSWLQKWGDKSVQSANSSSNSEIVNSNNESSSQDAEMKDKEVEATTTIYISSSDEEEEEEEGALVSHKKGRRNRKARSSPTNEKKEKETKEEPKDEMHDEDVAPPDNVVESTLLTDEAIACQLQEAEMRGESVDDEEYPVVMKNAVRRDEEDAKEREKKLKEKQEREDAALAERIQRQMMEMDEDDLPEERRLGRYGGYSLPYHYANDFGDSSPVVVTRTTTTPDGRTVRTTTTRTSTTSRGPSVHEIIEHRRNEMDRRATALFDMLEGLSIPPPVSSHGDADSSLARYHGIPLNYLRQRYGDGAYSDGEGDELDSMTYEDLLNLPTVERGVDDLNVFPLVKYSKTDTANPSCSVCLENFEEGEELRILTCFHKFHKDCIDRWLSNHRSCPFCKHDLSNN